ncbi:MAG TPA: RIP metalloprotease RseP [Nitrospiria bacterium]|jgi:regulator of sigma E protease
MVITVISFLLVVLIVVVFHEFGHFIVARFFGIKVLRFSIGFGPKIFAKQMGDTEYQVAAVPLGGFVKLSGEDPSEVLPEEEKAQSFSHQNVWKRIAVVAAGPIFSLLLAPLFFAGIFLTVGVQVATSEIGEVVESLPADSAGLKTGDRIVSIEGKPVQEWNQIKDFVQETQGREVKMLIDRGGREIETTITPELVTDKDILGDEFSEWRIGISPGGVETKPLGLFEALALSIERTYYYTELTLEVLVRMIQGRMSMDNLGGPIMIAQVSGQQASQGALSFLVFIAILSLNLGVFNLLPIPPLDGGHISFFLVEALIGKPVSLKAREVVTQVGVFCIFALLIFVSYNDIMRFFTK